MASGLAGMLGIRRPRRSDACSRSTIDGERERVQVRHGVAYFLGLDWNVGRLECPDRWGRRCGRDAALRCDRARGRRWCVCRPAAVAVVGQGGVWPALAARKGHREWGKMGAHLATSSEQGKRAREYQ